MRALTLADTPMLAAPDKALARAEHRTRHLARPRQRDLSSGGYTVTTGCAPAGGAGCGSDHLAWALGSPPVLALKDLCSSGSAVVHQRLMLEVWLVAARFHCARPPAIARAAASIAAAATTAPPCATAPRPLRSRATAPRPTRRSPPTRRRGRAPALCVRFTRRHTTGRSHSGTGVCASTGSSPRRDRCCRRGGASLASAPGRTPC